MIDKHGRNIDYLRISVTENCNLKCIYCVDENILNNYKSDTLSEAEKNDLLKGFIDKIVFNRKDTSIELFFYA